MTPKACMINVMADIIGLDDTYKGDRLNDETVWDRFMDEVLNRMDTIEDETLREILGSIDTEDFQAWIDDPAFWMAVNAEIDHRLNRVKALLPSPHEGRC
ncbi:hypothetical protein LJC71_00145 [Desulfosarcina sp. OttesenSCG-928-A07]|nr:hypothetical protein [Desulfosarcina sp. OttesenSCG-928-G17]MDL2328149.1 hypothetical protein [Desulfosarcina sp. OttesenSCG-928-A07]